MLTYANTLSFLDKFVSWAKSTRLMVLLATLQATQASEALDKKKGFVEHSLRINF
jgi:hypothetical protein